MHHNTTQTQRITHRHMHRQEEHHEGRVELDVGGVRYVTSAETLRRVPWTFFGAYFRGRYQLDRSEDGSIFIDRDGSLFGHVLEYLRDGVVSIAEDVDLGLLRRLKREFGFYSIDVLSKGAAYVMGGWTDSDDIFPTVERYDAASDTWSVVAPMGSVRTLFSACEISREVYVTGGVRRFDRPSRILAIVEKYSPSTDTWSEVARMPNARYCHGCVAVGSSMYIIGGYVPSGYIRTDIVEKFDTTTDTWTDVASMPSGLMDVAACVLGTHIYVFGHIGHYWNCLRALAYRYDTEADEWMDLEPMKRIHYSVSVCDSALFVLGGVNGNASLDIDFDIDARYVFRFDPSLNLWTRVASMETGRKRLTSFVLGGHIYAVGGLDSNNRSLNTVERYDASANRWSPVANMNVARALGTATIADGEAGTDLFESLITRAARGPART
jgi:N-acetylneuraminic acid mutarotase